MLWVAKDNLQTLAFSLRKRFETDDAEQSDPGNLDRESGTLKREPIRDGVPKGRRAARIVGAGRGNRMCGGVVHPVRELVPVGEGVRGLFRFGIPAGIHPVAPAEVPGRAPGPDDVPDPRAGLGPGLCPGRVSVAGMWSGQRGGSQSCCSLG